jgi:hypothetical protein
MMGLFSISELCLRYLWCNAICRLEYYLSSDQFEKASDADKKIKKAEKMIDALELRVEEYYESVINSNQ